METKKSNTAAIKIEYIVRGGRHEGENTRVIKHADKKIYYKYQSNNNK